jgi:hypothetical protein
MKSPVTPPLVQVNRKNERFSRKGFLVAQGRSLVVLHQVSDSYRLDGYCVMRRDDVLSIKRAFEKRSLILTALRIKAQAALPLPGLRATSMRSVMQFAQQAFGALVIHRERVQPDEVEVGVIRMTTDETYVLWWLSTVAKWDHDDRPFRYRDVTLLEFGTEYDQTLLAVAAARVPANPSLHPTAYSGLRPLPSAGELKR